MSESMSLPMNQASISESARAFILPVPKVYFGIGRARRGEGEGELTEAKTKVPKSAPCFAQDGERGPSAVI